MLLKLRAPLRVRTGLRVPRRTISRSTLHVTRTARWQKRTFGLKHPENPLCNLNHIPLLPVCFRRRSRISGLSLRYVWRGWPELSHCLQVGSESPAPHVTRVSITTTQPPAHRAHLGPTLMGLNVLRTLVYNVLLTGTLLLFLSILWFLFGSFLNMHLFMFSLQRVSRVRRALSPLWVMSINGGTFYLQTWRPPVSMWETPNVTAWMVNVLMSLLPLVTYLSIF